MHRLSAVAGVVIAAASLIHGDIASAAKAKAVPPPPYTGAYEPKTVDERGVWMLADEDERKLRDSSYVIADRPLNDYVRGVLCRAVGQERCAGVRLYIMRNPRFNATMYPNGMLQIWSGLLLRMQNEAELAGILGHEFAHFEQRHTLAGFRQRRLATDIITWASLGGQYGAAIQNGALASIFSFSRAQETEADLLGLKYLAASDYRKAALVDVWTRTMDEADATAAGRKQRSKRYDAVAFFAEHPTNLERATYLRKAAGDDAADGDDERSAYVRAIAPHIPMLLADQIKLNDFAGTDFLLNVMAKEGWTADLLYARGELYRARGNPRDLVSAADFYRASITAKGDLAEAWRGLGLVELRNRHLPEGREALSRYVSLSPSAPDVGLVKSLINQSAGQ